MRLYLGFDLEVVIQFIGNKRKRVNGLLRIKDCRELGCDTIIPYLTILGLSLVISLHVQVKENLAHILVI